MADYVQIAYDRVLSDGLPGSNANENPTYDACFIADGDTPYGVVVSNTSTALKPNMGAVGKVNVTATAGYAVGGSAADETNLLLVAAGGFKLYVDGTQITVGSVDLTSAVNLAGIASALQTAIRAVTSSTEVVAVVDGKIKITSATTGASSQIGPMTAPASGTDLTALLGWATYVATDGIAAVTAAILGVVIRNVVDQSSVSASNTPVIRSGNVGAYRMDGAIKVLAEETVTARASVYFDDTTGKLYGSSGAGRTQLGTSVWVDAVAAGKVGVIDVRGLR